MRRLGCRDKRSTRKPSSMVCGLSQGICLSRAGSALCWHLRSGACRPFHHTTHLQQHTTRYALRVEKRNWPWQIHTYTRHIHICTCSNSHRSRLHAVSCWPCWLTPSVFTPQLVAVFWFRRFFLALSFVKGVLFAQSMNKKRHLNAWKPTQSPHTPHINETQNTKRVWAV